MADGADGARRKLSVDWKGDAEAGTRRDKHACRPRRLSVMSYELGPRRLGCSLDKAKSTADWSMRPEEATHRLCVVDRGHIFLLLFCLA